MVRQQVALGAERTLFWRQVGLQLSAKPVRFPPPSPSTWHHPRWISLPCVPLPSSDSANGSSDACPPTRRFQRPASAWLTDDRWLGLGSAGGALFSKRNPCRLSILARRDPPADSRARRARRANRESQVPAPPCPDLSLVSRIRTRGIGLSQRSSPLHHRGRYDPPRQRNPVGCTWGWTLLCSTERSFECISSRRFIAQIGGFVP
jgi:hypothetical protein